MVENWRTFVRSWWFFKSSIRTIRWCFASFFLFFSFFHSCFFLFVFVYRSGASQSIRWCFYKWSTITKPHTIENCWNGCGWRSSMCYLTTVTRIPWMRIENIESLSRNGFDSAGCHWRIQTKSCNAGNWITHRRFEKNESKSNK